jgi:hypothetical protein
MHQQHGINKSNVYFLVQSVDQIDPRQVRVSNNIFQFILQELITKKLNP